MLPPLFSILPPSRVSTVPLLIVSVWGFETFSDSLSAGGLYTESVFLIGV
jgi:hypothetical protein